MSAENHLHELAESIGPRPATTDAEARAADYLERVFAARGLEVERHDFDCPRTYSWAFILYHLLTMGAAVAANWYPFAAAALGFVVAVTMWSDLDTRWGLSAVMPKGPSQNVIARHVPRARRGEKVRKVVLVAHYDSARASLAFSPALVRNFNATFFLMKAVTWVVPTLILVVALPWLAPFKPWTWYGVLAVGAYLLVPTLINLHRELFMKATDGANDNASGVAAMLQAMEAVVPEPEEMASSVELPRVPAPRLEPEEGAEAMPEEGLLSYAPAESHKPFADEGELDWEEPPAAGRGQESLDLGREEPRRPAADLGDWGTEELEPITPGEPRRGEPRDDAHPPGQPTAEEGRGRERGRGIGDWLGLGGRFNPRDEGKRIGTWDRFPDDDEDEDGLGWKGGAAGEAIDDPGFAESEAARIRRRVTTQVDRELVEKEVWFVATGAEESGTWGMRALLKDFGEDLRDALIINIDNVGAGTVSWVTSEGMARRYRCDRKLQSLARRVVREAELPIKGRDYHGLSTDATPALARGYKAMSVMAFDINGRLPNWHWTTDTVENVQPENLERVADFVTRLIREA